MVIWSSRLCSEAAGKTVFPRLAVAWLSNGRLEHLMWNIVNDENLKYPFSIYLYVSTTVRTYISKVLMALGRLLKGDENEQLF